MKPWNQIFDQIEQGLRQQVKEARVRLRELALLAQTSLEAGEASILILDADRLHLSFIASTNASLDNSKAAKVRCNKSFS